ncbi:MAG: GldM family protein [Flavobacteriales bacterium]
MAGGKETPRQKMIGMMYLVLTALLAMNISKDVLNAFLQINRSQMKTSEILNGKAQASLAALNSPKPEDVEKAKPFQTKAQEVLAKTDEIVKYLEELKARTMAASMKGKITGEGFEDFMENGKALDMLSTTGKLKVTKPDENTNATGFLIGAKPQKPKEDEWSGFTLKKKLGDYRDFMRAITVTNYEGKEVPLDVNIVASIDSAFQFNIEKNLDDEEEVWEVNRFHDTPLAACIATMSMLQTGVMNTQAQVMQWLQNSINATDVKFTDITVAAVPLNSYVLKGEEFVAEVYLAAYNKNSTTKIYPGGEYTGPMPTEVTEGPGASGNSIPSDVNGKCIFRVGTGGLSLGQHGYRGQISYLKDGQEKFLNYYIPPFTVGEPALVVNPKQMNVFYRGVDNPVEVSVPGVSPSQMKVNCEGCESFTKTTDSEWNVRPGAGKEAFINVTADINGNSTSMGKKLFRVKTIPDPTPSFNGKRPYDQTISAGDASSAAGLRAAMENFDFPVTPVVISWQITVSSGGTLKEYNCTGASINADASAAIKKARRGDRIFIEGIKCKMPDGRTIPLAPITLKLT